MDNWKDYVGIQHLQPGADVGLAYIIAWKNVDTGEQSLDAVKFAVTKFPYTDDDIGDAVEQALMSFPLVVCKNEIELNWFKNNVAMNSRRGVANTNFGNSWFYMSNIESNNSFDAALVVVQNNNHQYAIVKNPNFETYGFVIDNTFPMDV